jgi:hypothetical protein
VLPVTVVVVPGTGTVAVTVADAPGGTLETIVSAAPAALVTSGAVTDPVEEVKVTVTPATTRPLTSRTIASTDATGDGPMLTAAVSVTLAGMPVVEGVAEVGIVLFEQLALEKAKQARNRSVQRIESTIAYGPSSESSSHGRR